MATAQDQSLEGFREGARWINERPTGDQLAEWFSNNVTLHDGLEHEDYVSGIVIIEQKEKIKRMVERDDGAGTVIVEHERLTYTPYPTASARLAYWRDYLALNADKGWLGIIEPDPSVARSTGLPAGFFRYSVEHDRDGRKQVTSFVGCSMVARINGPEIKNGIAGRDILIGTPGSKVVPVIAWGRPDDNALMKAQTGAVGRALALAGMLVLPGTGIATAEDVRETIASDERAPVAEAPEAAAPAPSAPSSESEVAAPADPKAQALELISVLQAAYPDKHAEFNAWLKETNTKVEELEGQRLRGVVRRLRKLVDAGEAAASAAAATADAPEPRDPTKT